MATNSEIQSHTDGKLLQCASCTKSFESSGFNVPKIFPCEHSFCVACFWNILQGSGVQCPICSRQSVSTGDEMSESPALLQPNNRQEQPPEETDEPTELDERLRDSYEDEHEAKITLWSLDEVIQTSGKYSHKRLELILRCMNHYRSLRQDEYPDIVVACTACIYQLITNGGFSVELGLLGKVAEDTVAALEAFSSIKQLRVNVLSILSDGRLLAEAEFDYPKVMKLALDSLEIDETEDGALEILCRIPRRLTRQDNGALGGDAENMKKLLKILERKLTWGKYDQALLQLVEALISMTDETPPTCYAIVREKGVHLLTRLLRKEAIHPEFKATVLMLLANMSEVEPLREEIIKCPSLVDALQDSLQIKSIRVNFLAAGTVAELATVSEAVWTRVTGDEGIRENLLADLYTSVMSWESDVEPLNSKFRSFKPFYQLLQRYNAPAVQLYGAWILRNFSATDQRYKEMLIREEGIDFLWELMDNINADANVKELAKQTLESLQLLCL